VKTLDKNCSIIKGFSNWAGNNGYHAHFFLYSKKYEVALPFVPERVIRRGISLLHSVPIKREFEV